MPTGSKHRRAAHRTWLRRGLTLLVLVAAPVAEAAALRAEVLPLATRTRSGAPSLVEVKLRLSGAGLVQGRLELSLSRYGTVAAVVRSHELAVPASGLSLRMILPPLPGDGEVTVAARLLTADGAIPAGESDLWSLPGGGQNFVTAVVSPPTVRGGGEARLWQALRLERFADESKMHLANWSTSPAFLEPADLPEAALAWCVFDLVLLEGDSFARLRRRQLDALVQWVEGGGSVFIGAAGSLSPEHLAALHRLVPHPPGGGSLERDGDGKLVAPPQPVILSRPELGRCVLAPGLPQRSVDFASVEWREAAAFLWKVNAARFEQIRRDGFAVGTTYRSSAGSREWDQMLAQRLEAFLPRSVRMLPLGVIAGILAGFALAVGPGEWFVLGSLRLRRWTWLVFPLSAAAFTGATVLAANHYLGRSDHRAAIVISDLGRGGRVLRESRFEMWMAGENRAHLAELTRTLIVPTALGSRMGPYALPRAEPPLYEGQHPLRFTFRRELKQWEPRVQRTFTFDAAPSADGIDWDAVTAADLAAAERPTALFARQAHTGAFAIHIYHRGERTSDASGPEIYWDQYLSSREQGLIGTVISAISPSGDARGADLAIHDPGDPREWLVVALSVSGDTLQIRRRLYRTDE